MSVATSRVNPDGEPVSSGSLSSEKSVEPARNLFVTKESPLLSI